MTTMDAGDVGLLKKRLSQRYPLVRRSIEVGGRLRPVTAVQDQDTLIDAVETEHDLHFFPYGMLLWPAAIALARHFAANADMVCGKRVLELGAGAGLPGIVAAGLGAAVTQTDYQRDALNLARINAADNDVAVDLAIGDWRNWQVQGEFDLVIGSDVLYERSLHYELKRIFDRYADRGAHILVSDPLRPQAMEFITQREKDGWMVDMDTQEVYWEGEEKEIVMFLLGHPN